jgi:VWFA-related protein
MHSLRLIASLAFAGQLIAGSAANAAGQATQPQAAQPTPASAVSPSFGAGSTILRTNVDLVLVDVVVTDRGNAVHGLDRNRFHVFEDGVEQTIVSFDEREPNNEPVARVATAQTPLPPHTYSNAPAYPEISAVNVLLLDGLNTPIENQAEMRRQVVEYLSKAEPGTSLAIFTLASRLQMGKGFTTDATELTNAVQSGKAGSQQSVLLDTQSALSLDSRAAELATSGKVIALIQQQLANIAAYQTDQRVRMTLDALRQLARYLSAIPGRKNLIWFSGSFPIALDPNDQLIEPLRTMRNYTDEVRETNELLATARVAVYPVDARGVMTQSSASASYKPMPNIAFGRVNLPAPAKDDTTFQRQTESEHASMERIADATGGKAYTNTNDLKKAMEDAVKDGSSYYTIGYVPPVKPPDGQFRKIHLRLDHGGYTLTYRKGYYVAPFNKLNAGDPGATSLIATATLHGAPPATQILFKARVLDVTDPTLQGINLPKGPAGEMGATLKEPVRRYIAELTVDPNSIVFDELPDGQHEVHLEFAMVGFDAEGKRVNYLGRSVAMKFDSAQFAQIMTNGVRVRMSLDVPPGEGFLRIAVHDLSGARVGSLEVPLAVAAR